MSSILCSIYIPSLKLYITSALFGCFVARFQWSCIKEACNLDASTRCLDIIYDWIPHRSGLNFDSGLFSCSAFQGFEIKICLINLYTHLSHFWLICCVGGLFGVIYFVSLGQKKFPEKPIPAELNDKLVTTHLPMLKLSGYQVKSKANRNISGEMRLHLISVPQCYTHSTSSRLEM